MKVSKERVTTQVIQLQLTDSEADLLRRGLEEVDMYYIPSEVYEFLRGLNEKLDELIGE